MSKKNRDFFNKTLSGIKSLGLEPSTRSKMMAIAKSYTTGKKRKTLVYAVVTSLILGIIGYGGMNYLSSPYTASTQRSTKSEQNFLSSINTTSPLKQMGLSNMFDTERSNKKMNKQKSSKGKSSLAKKSKKSKAKFAKKKSKKSKKYAIAKKSKSNKKYKNNKRHHLADSKRSR